MFKNRNKKGHGRSGSTPGSTEPSSQLSPLESTILQQPPKSAQSHRPTLSPSSDEHPNFFFFNRIPEVTTPTSYNNSKVDSPISPFPPTLPPIPRVASVRERQESQIGYDEAQGHARNGSGDSRLRPVTSNRSDPELEVIEGGTLDFRTGPARPRRSNDGRASPSMSRPHTAGSTTHGYAQRSEVSSSSSSAQLSSVRSPSIYLTGPVRPQNGLASPSKFPSESHRPPPKPPHPSGHSFTSRPLLRGSATAPMPLPKQSKTKLNLLNPMSLLLRRRSGQTLEHLSDDALISHRNTGSTTTLPDNFDPSIRGVGVHDFSAPRQRRNFSSSSLGGAGSIDGMLSKDLPRTPHSQEAFSPQEEYRADREHTPVFREHFDDDLGKDNNNSAIRAETLANKDFIARNTGAPPMPTAPPPLPPFVKSVGPVPPQVITPEPLSFIQQEPLEDFYNPESGQLAPPPAVAIPLSPVMEDEASQPSRKPTNFSYRNSTTNSFTSKRLSSNSRGSRSSVGTDPGFDSAGLPTHMNSRSSRFSFQLAGKDSAAQERLLEERHMEKAAAKALAEKNRQAEEDESEEDDEYGYDDMGDEEDVPTFGDDWGYGGGGLSNMSLGAPTDNDNITNVATLALRGNPVNPVNPVNLVNPVNPTSLMQPVLPVQGLGILSPLEEEEVPGTNSLFTPGYQSQEILGQRPLVPKNYDDDDMYFNDGMIDEVNFDDSEKFDESVLDDPSHPLYERKPKRFSLSDDRVPKPTPMREGQAYQAESESTVIPKPSGLGHERTVFGGSSSTYPNANPENLDTYHSILAMAAIKAAESGRFHRHDSFDNITPERSPAQTSDEGASMELSSRPSLIPDESRNSQATTISPLQGPITDVDANAGAESRKSVGVSHPQDYSENYCAYSSDFSDYDTAFDEDPIIAAANAEALANDDDGFYGTEFGFYAKPSPLDTDGSNSEQAEFFQGGYFGPKEWSEIKRQRSTREPNLTPITERSEHSTRNSFVSLPTLDRGPQASPGLAALARMGSGWDSDMNMESLLKLRRGAFGGSQGSIGSFSSGRDQPSSPLASSPIVQKMDSTRNWDTIVEQNSEAEDEDEGQDTSGETDYFELLDDTHGEWEDVSDVSSTEPDDGMMEPNYNYSGFDSPTVKVAPTTPDSLSTPVNVSTRSTMFPTHHPTPLPNFVFPQGPEHQRHQPNPTSLQESIPSNTTTTIVSIPPPQHSKAASGTFYSPASPLTPNPPMPAPNPPLSPAKSASHSRSGSDSVAYVREREDENGQFRWVLERRRMGEDGVESVVERTLVEGGKI